MKIAYTGLDLPQGKKKYNDGIFVDIVIANEYVLDLLILDMEKIEGRLSRTEDPSEKAVLEKCLAQLEDQKPICDLSLDNSERAIVKALRLLSFTPTVVYKDTSPDANIVPERFIQI
jgi:hypothetical protein